MNIEDNRAIDLLFRAGMGALTPEHRDVAILTEDILDLAEELDPDTLTGKDDAAFEALIRAAARELERRLGGASRISSRTWPVCG